MRYTSLLSFVSLLSLGCSAPASDSAALPSPSSLLAGLGVDLSKYLPDPGNAAQTCKILNVLFPRNETFTVASPLYTPLYEVPWSQTCWLQPACIMTPNNPKELSIMVRVLTVLRTKFAIRGAGHKPTPGFNGIGSDGVLLAMQNLKNLAMSSDKKTVTVGAGNRWRDVYTFVIPYNVAVVGGREPMVGVTGFLLGGGVNLFLNHWGLSLDLVSRFQVVLMDGSIVNATPTTNADLFHALKGGMSNFGIITEFDLMTRPETVSYYEVYEYTVEQTPALIKAYGEYLADPATDPKSSVEIEINSAYSAAFLGYITPTSEPKDFARFRSLKTNVTLLPPTNGTLDTVIFGIGGAATTLGSWVGKSFSHKVINGDLMQYSYALMQNASAKLPPTMYLTYVPQGVLPNLVTVGNSLNGGNILGISPTPQVWVDLYMTYTFLNQTEQATAIVEELFAAITAKADADGLALPYLFASTASNTQKPLLSFGAQNFQTIKTVATKYDPRGFMQSLQNDGYLIRNS